MKYSKKQQLIKTIEAVMTEDRYIVNKREKGQQRVFTCKCCGQSWNLDNTVDYVGAVEQWKSFGEKCYACGRGFCHCAEGGWPKNSK